MKLPVAPPLGTENPERRRALDPYLDRIRRLCETAAAAPARGAVKIRFGQRDQTLERWELEQARAALQGDPEGDPVCAARVLEILALLFKSLVDSEKLEADPHGDVMVLYGLQAEVMLDTTLGGTLLAETQAHVEAMIAGGQADEARHLSRLQHKLRHETRHLKARIRYWGERNLDPTSPLGLLQAERSPEPVVPPVGVRPAPHVSPVRRRRPATAVARATGSVTPLLVGILVLVVAGWLLLVGLPAMSGGGPDVSDTELLHIPELVGVRARPPSLYVDVEIETWDELDKARRNMLVERVSEVAARYGYSSALLQTPEGRSLATWWQAAGVLWREHREVLGDPIKTR